MPSSAGASTSGLSFGQLQQLDNLSLSTSTNTAVSAASASASHHHPRIPLRTKGAPHTPNHRHSPSEDGDARSVGSRLSNAGSTYSAATFYSFGTSNYSGFASSSPARRAMLLTATEGGAGGPKRHFVHPQELDPDAVYEVDWVQDDAAKACMACYAEFSALIRRKHHCRACGRVVCSTCLRHKLPVQGLRGLQKACDDCADAAQGRTHTGGLPLSTSVALIQRGACESISEDEDAEVTTTPQPSPAVAAVADAPASCCGGEKEEAAEEELLAGASAAQLHRWQKSLEAKAKAAFPTEENKGGNKGKRASKLGYWALAVGAIGGAVTVGSVLLAKRNPELVASMVAQVKRATARR